MGRIYSLAVKSVVPAAALLLAASLAAVARAGDNQPKLSGRWEFNKDQSDDAQQKISDAQSSQRSTNDSGGGYPGGGVLVEGVVIPGVEAAGREVGWACREAGWDVEAWAAGEDKAIAAEAP